MIVAFEGPDGAGKTTLAHKISYHYYYNLLAKDYPKVLAKKGITGIDRVAWITHYVYRLSLPYYEWHDPLIRTVFSMPEAHLVFLFSSSFPKDDMYTKEEYDLICRTYSEICSFFGSLMLHPYAPFRSISCFYSLDVCGEYRLGRTFSVAEEIRSQYAYQRMTAPDIFSYLSDVEGYIVGRND